MSYKLKVCPNCSAENVPGETKCSKCKHSLTGVKDTEFDTYSGAEVEQGEKPKRKSKETKAPEKAGPNYCPYCGSKATGRFCLNCGKQLSDEPDSPVVEELPERKHKRRRLFRPTRKQVLITLGCLGVGLLLFFQQIEEWVVVHTADSAMVSLAQESGMSYKGEVEFLRMHPELVSDSQMTTVCADNAAANNSNGFIEQGCYVPDKTNPATGKIYIREMPQDLHSMEVATAAYEMLHPVYIQLLSMGKSKELNAAIESNFTVNNDANLTTQVANFAKTEPTARDLELFSILGVEYSNISSDLSAYYAPYFTDLSSAVTANNQVDQLFQADEAQLTQLQATIDSYDSKANQALALGNTAYYDSTTWARVGNAYENNRNYNIYVQDFNIYKQDIASENSTIDQYNQLLNQINILITEYQGTQPVNTKQGVQAQQSH